MKKLATIFGFLLAVIAGAYLLWLLPPVNNYVKNAIEAAILERSGLKVSLKDVSWGPPLNFSLHDITISRKDGTVIHIDRLAIKPSIKDLFKGVLSLRSLQIGKVDVGFGEGSSEATTLATIKDGFQDRIAVCPLEIAEFSVEGMYIKDFEAFPIEGLKIRGSLSCPKPLEGWSAAFEVYSENSLGTASVNIALDRSDKTGGAALIIEERHGGIILKHYFDRKVDNAKVLVTLLSNKTGHIDWKAESGGENPWTIASRGEIDLNNGISANLVNHVSGVISGIQQLRFHYNPLENNIQLSVNGGIKDSKLGQFEIKADGKGALDSFGGVLEIANHEHASALEMDYQLSNLSVLSLKNIQGSWKEASLKGKLQASFSPLGLEGSISFQKIDSLLDFLPQLPFSIGSANGHATFGVREGSQMADVRMEASELGAGRAALSNAHIHLFVKDLLDGPKAKLLFKADNISMDTVKGGPVKFTSRIEPGKRWPFTVKLEGSDALPLALSGNGQWIASPGKFSLNIHSLEGAYQEQAYHLQRNFDFSYDNGLFSFSPFMLKINEGTLYLALNEIGNNFELSSYYLNLSPSVIDKLFRLAGISSSDSAPAYWNLKAHLRWAADFDSMRFFFSAANKETAQATTCSINLKDMPESKSVLCSWDIAHPANGILSLFSPEANQLAFQSQNEWDISSPSITSLLLGGSIPHFTGHSMLNYQWKDSPGQLLTNVSYDDHLFRLLAMNFKSDVVDANGKVSLDTLTGKIDGTLQAEGKAIAAQADIHFNGTVRQLDYLAVAQYAAENMEKQLLNIEGTLDSSGTRGKVEAALPFANKPSAAADYSIRFDPELSTQIHLALNYSDSGKSLNSMGKIQFETTLEGPLRSLKGRASLTSSGARLDGNKFPPMNLTANIAYPAADLPVSFSMENTFSGQGAVTFLDNEASFTLVHLHGESAQQIHLPSPWTIQWKESTLDIKPLRLEIGKGFLELDGKADKNNFQLFVKGRDIIATIPLGDANMPANAKITVEGAFNGPWNAPEALAHISAEDIQIIDKFFGKAPRCHASFDLSLKPSQAVMQGEILCPGIEPVTMNVKLPMTLSLVPFDVSIDRDAPLKGAVKVSGALGPLFDIFLPHITSFGGYVTLAVDVAGSINSPSFTGLAALDGGTFENLETGTLLNNITLKARADGSNVIIENITAQDRQKGTLTGSGSMLLDRDKNYPFEIATKLNRINLVQTDIVRSAFDGSIVFKGDTNGMAILGKVEPVQAMLYIPEEIPEGTETVDVIYVNVPEDSPRRNYNAPASPGSTYPVQFDLDVSGAHRIHILGRGLESSWRGQAHISGPLSNPNVQGDVKIVRGTYVFKGRIFDIKEGTIAFSGPWDTKTKLYVIASQEVDDIIIEAILRGPLKNPSLSFRSNPPMPQKDIVSFLLFGKGSSEISPYQGNELSQSISNLRNVDDSPDLLTKVRTRLYIDRLDINREATSEGDKVSVQVGKYVCKGVYVSLNKSITDESNSIAIDAKVSKHIRARAEVSDNAETQLLLKWKHDF